MKSKNELAKDACLKMGAMFFRLMSAVGVEDEEDAKRYAMELASMAERFAAGEYASAD